MTNKFMLAIYDDGVAGLTPLAELDTPILDPAAYYRTYVNYKVLGDKMRFGMGAPWAEWLFPLLTIEQRNQLREFCPGASTRLYLRTISEDQSTFEDFLGIMIWPLNESPVKAGFLLDLIIRFEDLELQEDIS